MALLDLPAASGPELSSDVLGRAIFDGIRASDPNAERRLYELIRNAVRASLRELYEDRGEDVCHDVFLATYTAIQEDQLRDPSRLLGYLRTIIYRAKCSHIGVAIKERLVENDALPALVDQRPTIDEHIEETQNLAAISRGMETLPYHSRVILEDFYLNGLPQEEIIERHGLTHTQYRLSKSRGLQRLRMAVQKASMVDSAQACCA